jgi:D-3-phosphoglycerate dehydrogenase
MSRDIVIVAERLAESGLDRLRSAGFDVRDCSGVDRATLLASVSDAKALIVRSATAVDRELLTHAPDLAVVARAGVGLDNIDLAAATERGVLVANAPESNVLSAAEHTMGLILALARNIPQAHRSLVEGRWERSKWEGVELAGKTLAICGLGRIGSLVARRAKAFDLHVVGYDPYVSPERARELGVELLSLADAVAQADFLTVHLPRTRDTENLINLALLRTAKPTLRVINVARGGIINETDLDTALRDGIIAGAALDVFATEPTTSSDLFTHNNVVVTPHLGASTAEAQDRAGVAAADMVCLALSGEFVPFAVNSGIGKVAEATKPFIALAERLGRVFASYLDVLPHNLEVIVQGEIGAYAPEPIGVAALTGLLGRLSDRRVSAVNASAIAAELGMKFTTSSAAASHHGDYLNLVVVRAGRHSMAATLSGRRRQARIVMIDDHLTDVPPSRHLLVIKNNDKPGAIGRVTSVLGNRGINISNMGVGNTEEAGSAIMCITTDTEVADTVIDELRLLEGIGEVKRVEG